MRHRSLTAPSLRRRLLLARRLLAGVLVLAAGLFVGTSSAGAATSGGARAVPVRVVPAQPIPPLAHIRAHVAEGPPGWLPQLPTYSDRFGLVNNDGSVNANAIPGLTLPPSLAEDWFLDDTEVTPGSSSPPDANAPAAWLQGALGQGQVVADVDSGIVTASSGVQVAPGGWDFVDNAPISLSYDPVGHGTWTAGLIGAGGGPGSDFIGAGGGPGSDFIGMAPRAQILPVRVLGSNGWGTGTAIAAGLAYAAARARVVNASLGAQDGHPQDTPEYQVFEEHSNVLFVLAAGNDGVSDDITPFDPCNAAATLSNVLCVSATDQTGALASFSDFGAQSVDLSAPGVSIYGDFAANSTPTAAFGYGTSAAAPLVSGTAALMLSVNPSLTAAQLKQLLLSSARRVPDLMGTSVTGGLLDAGAAVAAARAAADEPPSSAPTTSPTKPGISQLYVSGRGRHRVLHFMLSAPAQVRVHAHARVCTRSRCSWRTVLDRTVSARAGVNAVSLSRWPRARLRYRVQVVSGSVQS